MKRLYKRGKVLAADHVKVRFAPSPTGHLHIGGARTALFNYFYAKGREGKFVLRIEDTDRERSRKEFEDEIINDLAWLGVTSDEPVVRQSERADIYRKHIDKLLKQGSAYYPEENKEAVSFKMPKEKVKFTDIVHGLIEMDSSLFGDLVIQKSDGSPTFNFACIVDDCEMGITHVIRGDDHISNTPKQILLARALGFKPPKYAHVPLIVGSDGAPLSKRHGVVALDNYRKAGYLPQGLVNYLSLLGWGPANNQEFFKMDELIKKFSVKKINKTSAAFDADKLDWINSCHIRDLSDSEYLTYFLDYCELERVVPQDFDLEKLKEAALLYKGRIRTFRDFFGQARFLFSEEVAYDPEAVQKYLKNEGVRDNLKTLFEALGSVNFGDLKILEEAVRNLAKKKGVKAGEFIHPLRVCVTGKSVSAGIFEVLKLVGREKALKRIRWVLDNFEKL